VSVYTHTLRGKGLSNRHSLADPPVSIKIAPRFDSPGGGLSSAATKRPPVAIALAAFTFHGCSCAAGVAAF
jgi:hypothetical protein